MSSRPSLPRCRPCAAVRLLVLVLVFHAGPASHAQSAGPNNPATAVNSTGIGANAWSNPGNALTSNNVRATLATKGITNYLTASNFGFSIPSPANITGIQLDVERSTTSVNNVALLNGWSTGLSKTISAGTNRCLLVAYVQENGIESRDISAMTYGGRSMTQVTEVVRGVASGFNARIEIWALLEADIALASGTAIVPTYGPYSPLEYCEIFTAATFQHVDQLNPVSNTQGSGAQGTSNPHQLGTAITTLAGSMAINVVTCGNNTVPGVTDGGTNTYTINSGYTEGIDQYFANTSVAPTSGACIQTAHKAITSAGTEQPSCTFNGDVNRWAMIGLTLQRAREMDHTVRLMKGGTIGGSDLANTISWPTTDTYVSYGGSTQLWGQAWTRTDVQASNFGAAISARVQNGTAAVDHMRMTVYYYSTLPVQLLYFRALQDGRRVHLKWATASESGSEHFEVQRSTDGGTFTTIAIVPASGNSSTLLEYEAHDDRPLTGAGYYRLKQVDSDGSSTLSDIVVAGFHPDALMPYPNPTEGVLHLGEAAVQGQEVQVFNEAMQLMLKAPLTAEDPIVNLERLPDGIYTILVFNGGTWSAARAVKRSSMR